MDKVGVKLYFVDDHDGEFLTVTEVDACHEKGMYIRLRDTHKYFKYRNVIKVDEVGVHTSPEAAVKAFIAKSQEEIKRTNETIGRLQRKINALSLTIIEAEQLLEQVTTEAN